MTFEKELKAALQAVQRASQLCSKVQFQLIDDDTIQKKDRSPVTIADFGSQAVVSSILLDELSNDFLVGEEEAETLRQNDDMRERVFELVKEQCPDMTEDEMMNAIARGTREPDYTKRYWTIDPIDGTKGFLRREQYAVALALIENGKKKVGVLGCPNLPQDFNDSNSQTGSLLYAVAGEGAWMSDMNGGDSRHIQVNSETDPSGARFVESVESAHSAHDVHTRISAALGITQESLRIDSQCKYATVARGDVSIYLRYPRDEVYREKIWDHAAGALIVEVAGGKVTDIAGQPLDFSVGRKLEKNQGVVVTNGAFHDQIISEIKKIRG